MTAQDAEGLKFEQRKDALLEALGCGSDRSKKGSFDAPINDMLSHLNMHEDYMSTSSCSGRIVLFREYGAGMGKTAKGGEWVLCKHGTITKEELSEGMNAASKGSGLVYFRHEPFILHVQCKRLPAAIALMEVARAAGFRESGISVGKKHVIVAVRTSSLRMDSPVAEDGRQIVPDDYMSVLMRLANDKFAKNRDKTDFFYTLLKRDLLHSTLAPLDGPDVGVGQPLSSVPPEPPARLVTSLACGGHLCELVRKEAQERGWLDKTRRNTRLEDGRIAIPLLPAAGIVVDGGSQGLICELVLSGQAQLSYDRECPPSGGGRATESPHYKLKVALEGLAKECGVQVGGGEVPLKRWEEMGDLAVCPGEWLKLHPWSELPSERVWKCVAESLGKMRIAVKAEVDVGAMRRSHAGDKS